MVILLLSKEEKKKRKKDGCALKQQNHNIIIIIAEPLELAVGLVSWPSEHEQPPHGRGKSFHDVE